MDNNISLLIVGIVLLFFSFCFLLGAFLLHQRSRSFAQNAIKTEGVMVGCRVKDNTSTEEPQVRFTDDAGHEVFATAQPVTLKKPACKNGTVLHIAYCKRNVHGNDFYDLRIRDSRYIRESHFSALAVCAGIGFSLLVPAIILFILVIL